MSNSIFSRTGYLNSPFSARYGSGTQDLRSRFLKLCGFLQGKKVVILNSDPKLCGEILAASDTKGTFIEHLIATPAWDPIISTESVDGETWKILAQKFKIILGKTRWRERITPIISKSTHQLQLKMERSPELCVNAEEISRISLRILFELLFESPLSNEDEDLFYLASLEWRKEIGMKGRGNPEVKRNFWKRLASISEASSYKDVLCSEPNQEFWLSTFAQPFIISPQINISDIMVASFQFLRKDAKALNLATQWAVTNDKARLGGILLEAIRLQHPFPILERELEKGTRISSQTLKSKTQFFLLFDQFKQDMEFNPERWLASNAENPYHSIPFGTGPRMCLGKPIAMEVLTELLRSFLTDFPIEKIQPQIGHLYSGRDNDQQLGLSETVYQFKTITQALWRSAFLNQKKRASPKPIKCPWKRTTRFLNGSS